MQDKVEVPFIIFFDADEETMIQRIIERSKESGRNDDNIDVLRKRFDTFLEQTMPIVEMYENKGKCKRINALKSIDEVYEDVKKSFEGYL